MIPIVEAANKLGFKNTDPLYARAKKGLINIIEQGKHTRFISKEDFDKLVSECVPADMKRCKICKYEGDKDEPGWHGFICRKCDLKNHKEYQKKNKKSISKKNKLYYQNNKDSIIEKTNNYYQENRNMVKKRMKKYYDENQPEIRINRKLKKYNITLDEYQNLKTQNDGRCDICNEIPEKACIDHCHKTEVVRGLLCNKCNSGIGFLQDDIELLENAVSYLKKYLPNDDENIICAYYYGAKRGVLPSLVD